MNKSVIALSIILLALWTQPASAREDDFYLGESRNSGGFNVFIGKKSLDSSWDPVQGQMEIGLKFDYKRKDWPVSIAFDVLASNDSQVDISTSPGIEFTGSTFERNIGARFDSQVTDSLNIFAGGGISFIRASFKSSESGIMISDAESAVGNWFEAGLRLTTDNLSAGIDIIQSSGNMSLYGKSVNAGGLHFGLLFGLKW
ncbi:MAG: hypothetical protein AB1599_00010 [Planctomycetota bacterium]